jgi:hypothetical protein
MPTCRTCVGSPRARSPAACCCSWGDACRCAGGCPCGRGARHRGHRRQDPAARGPRRRHLRRGDRGADGRTAGGGRVLRFVHALVRSAVYQDLAVPVRQRWHQRAARMLDAEGAPQEVRSGCCAEPCPSAQAAPGRGPCRTVLRMPLTDGRCGSPARRAVGPGEAPVADQGHGHAGVLGHHVERAADSSLQLQPQGGWHFG